MLAITPLADSTNVASAESPHAPAGLDFLSLLADASLQRLGGGGDNANSAKKMKVYPPAPLECTESTLDEVVGLPTPLETSVRPRCPSRTRVGADNDDTSSSRSSSPASLVGGKAAYVCNKCARGYASTDAVRKHARQNHPEWLKEQGQGCPSLYCTPIEHAGSVGMALEGAAATTSGAGAAAPAPMLATPMLATPMLATPMLATPMLATGAAPAVATPTGAVLTTPAPAAAPPLVHKAYVTAATTIAPGTARPAALVNVTPSVNMVPAQLAASVQAHSTLAPGQVGHAAAVHAAIADAVAATSASATTGADANTAAANASSASSRAATVPTTPLSPGSSSMLQFAAESLSGLSKAAMFSGEMNIYASRADSDYGDEEEAADQISWLRREASWPLQGGGGGGSGSGSGPKRNKDGRQKRPRSVRCGNCEGCTRDDCGTCKNCVDKPKFGGIGQRKQGCIRKLCRAPRVATALPNGLEQQQSF